MPTFLINAPDGRQFEVTGPEGATQEEALSRVRSQESGGGNAFVGDAPARPEQGDFAAGVNSGTDSMEGMAYGFAALLGDTVGHRGLTDWGIDNYKRKNADAARNAPRLQSFREVEGVGDFIDYAQGVIGQTAPFSLTTVAGGGVGGLLAKAVAPRLLAKKIGEETAKKAVERIMKDKAASAVMGKAVGSWMKRGTVAGSATASAVVQQGGLYGELTEAGVEDAVAPAWFFGALQGGLDVLPEVLVASKFFPKKVQSDLVKSLMRGEAAAAAPKASKVLSAIKTAGQVTAAEATTEGAQEALSVLARMSSDDTFSWDDKANERVLDAVVAGAVAGLFLGGGTGGLSELMKKSEQEKKNAKPLATPAGKARPAKTPPPAGAAPVGAGAPDVRAGSAEAVPAVDPVPGAAAASESGAAENASTGTVLGTPSERGANNAGPLPGAAPAVPAAGPAPAAVTDAPSPEPLRDLEAQFRDVVDTRQNRKGVYIAAPTTEAKAWALKKAQRGMRILRDVDGKGGILVTSEDGKKEFETRKRAGENLEAVLGEFTGAAVVTPTKPQTQTPVVVQQRTADGAVTRETVVAGENPAQVAQAQEALAQEGRSVETKPAEQALVERDDQIMREAEEAYADRPATRPRHPDEEALVDQQKAAAATGAAPARVQQLDSEIADLDREIAESDGVVMAGQLRGLKEMRASLAEERAQAALPAESGISPLPYLNLTVPQFQEWLQTDPPFLGDIDAASSDEERLQLLGEYQIFLEWIGGSRGKKPSSYIRKSFEEYKLAKNRERDRLDQLDYDLPTSPDSGVEEDLPDIADPTPEEVGVVNAVLSEVAAWIGVSSNGFNRLATGLLSDRSYIGQLVQELQRGEGTAAVAAKAIGRFLNEKAAGVYRRQIESAKPEKPEQMEELPDIEDGYGEVDMRDPSRVRFVGQDGVIEGVKAVRSKDDVRKGKPTHQLAKPWKDLMPAEKAANEMALRDPTTSYSVVHMTAIEARLRGIDMPAHGAGYYVLGSPRFDSEMRYSPEYDTALTEGQAALVAVRRGKKRFHDVYSDKIKNHPTLAYGIPMLVDGETTMIATRDVVELGFFLSPVLRQSAKSDRATALMYALYTGINALNLAGSFGGSNRFPTISAHTVLEHKASGRPVTLAKVLADRMYTREEIIEARDTAEAALLKRNPKAARAQREAAGEAGKRAFFAANHPKRFAQAVAQAQLLINAGLATTGNARASAKSMEHRVRRQRQAGSAAYDPRMDRSEETQGDMEQTLGDQIRNGSIDEVDSIALRSSNPAGTAPAGARERMIPSDKRTTNPAQASERVVGFGGRLGSTLGTVPAGRSTPSNLNADPQAPPAQATVDPTIEVTLPVVRGGVQVGERTESLPMREATAGLVPREARKPITDASVTDPEQGRFPEPGVRRTLNPAPDPAPSTEQARGIPPTSGPRSPGPPPRQTPVNGIIMSLRDAARGETVRKIAEDIRRILRIDDVLVFIDNAEDAVKYARLYGIDERVAEKAATETGQSGTAIYGDGASLIFLSTNAKGPQLIKTLAHEIGHVFYEQHWREANSDLRRLVRNEYEAFLKTAAGKKFSEARAKRGTTYSLSEYIADQVAVYINTDVEAASTVARWYKDLAVYLLDVFKWLTERGFVPGQSATQFIKSVVAPDAEQISEGLFDQPHPAFESVPGDVNEDMNTDPLAPAPGSSAEAIRNYWRAMRLKFPTVDKYGAKVVDGLKALHASVLSRIFVRIERMNNPVVNKIFANFHVRVGADLAAEGRDASTFFTDTDGWYAKFVSSFAGIVRGMDERQKADLMRVAMQEQPIVEGYEFAPQLRALRALFAETHQYMLDAGLPVRSVANYFTQVYDQETMQEEGAVEEIVAKLVADGLINPVTSQPYDAAWVTRLLETITDGAASIPYSGIDETIEEAPDYSEPFAQATRHRTVPDDVRASIRSIVDDKGRPKYMAKSLDFVMQSYFKQTTVRSEVNRRFGEQGFLARKQAWEESDPETRGVPPRFDPFQQLNAQLAEARLDRDELQFVKDSLSAMLGQYGRIGNPNLRKLTNGMMVFQNLRTLLFVTLSSFPDIANNFIRTGEFKDTFAVLYDNMKSAIKGDLNDQLAMYGYAADALDGSIMQDLVSMRDGDGLAFKINHTFFKAIGLHRWTNFTRALAMKTSMHYIQKHANLAREGDEQSQRHLDELGISAADVDAWVESGYATKFTNGASPEVARVTAAIQQMISDIVIHPTPPEKTLWGNSEIARLVWHLKSFMYGFSTRVLGRAFHEIQKNGIASAEGAAMIGALALLLPLAAFGLALRDLTQYWAWGKETYTPYDDPFKYMMTLLGRSGITGFAQLPIDGINARGKGRAPVLAFAGPTVTWVNDWMEYPLHKTVPGSIPIIASVPGIRNEISEWMKPEAAQ